MDNEVLKAIRERRSLRHFKGEQVGDDALKAVLEAGTWAPRPSASRTRGSWRYRTKHCGPD